MSYRDIVVCADKATVAVAAAQFVLGEIERKESGKFLLALSGGTTPSQMYDVIAQTPGARELIVSRCEIFFSDERSVGPNDPDSNFHTAKEHLLDPLGIPEQFIHRMRGESNDLDAETSRYARLIREKASVQGEQVPALDLTLLGMGPDGHTASLFPEYDFAKPDDSLIVAPIVKSKGCRRLSFSLTLINASRAVLMIVTGSDKAEAVNKVLTGPIDEYRLPASRVQAARTVWMLDREAASLLNWTGRVLSL